MKRITPNRAVLFVVVMTAVAFVVYLPRYRTEQRRAQAAKYEAAAQANQEAATQRAMANEAAVQKAAREAAMQQAEYMARYLKRGFARKPGLKMVAIAAKFQNDEADRPIADALARHLENGNLALFTSFFKPAFYADGVFSNVFAGSMEPIDRLELTNILDALVLAHEQVQYSTNGPEVNNVITANARLEVAFLPFGLMRLEHTWTYLASGAGFNLGEARSNAEERLLKQIAGDTNISLVSLPSEKQESNP
jgi:hypothetical protein